MNGFWINLLALSLSYSNLLHNIPFNIAEPGSLKAALACQIELNDTEVVRVSLDREYGLAEISDEPPPPRTLPPKSHESLTELHIQHFAQCLRYVAKKAKAKRNGDGGGDGAENGSDQEGGSVNDDSMRKSNNEDKVEELSAYTSKDAMMAQGAWNTNGKKEESEEWGLLAPDVEEGRPLSSSPMHSTEHHKHLENKKDDELMERAWNILSRCDGRCGQLLGHAVAKGLPWVRSWTCSLVVWHGSGLISNVPGCDTFLHDTRFLSVKAVVEHLDKVSNDSISYFHTYIIFFFFISQP
jgi:hypothetical protein